MPAPLSDVLSASAASPSRALSASPPRSSISSSSSAVGLARRATPEYMASHYRHPEWTATRRSPLQLPPISLPKNGNLTGLGLGFSTSVPPPDDYLSPPWSVGRRVYSDGKPSPDDFEYKTSPFGLHDVANNHARPRSSSSASQPPGDGSDDAPGTESNSVSRRPRILMDAKQTAHLNALWGRTYFPTTAEREHLAQLANLTPRQVQVWFQNQRQKQRRVLHDPTASTEEKAELADLRHSPRTRRKMTLQAARMANNDYMEYGLAPLSPRAQSPMPPVRSHPYRPCQQVPYHQYTSAVSSREYVPPKATISRMSSRPFGERDIYRMNIEPFRHALHRGSSVAGWQREHSPPLTASSSTPLHTRKRFEDEDDLQRPRYLSEHGLPSPPALEDRDMYRLPPISSLDLPPILRSGDYSIPSPRPNVLQSSARRAPSFTTLLNAM